MLRFFSGLLALVGGLALLVTGLIQGNGLLIFFGIVLMVIGLFIWFAGKGSAFDGLDFGDGWGGDWGGGGDGGGGGGSD